MRETWYVLDDGSFADPAECAPDADGVLSCGGVAVARRGGTYSSRSMSAEDVEAVRKPHDMEAEKPKRAYNRRDMKAND